MESAPEPTKNPPRTPEKKMIVLAVFCAVPTLLLVVTSIVGEIKYSYSSSSSSSSSPSFSPGNDGDDNKDEISTAMDDGPCSAAAPVVSKVHDHSHINTTIRNACTNTLYPPLCFSTLSSSSALASSKIQTAAAANALTFRDVLEIGINETVKFIQSSQWNIGDLLQHHYLMIGSQEKNALKDCMEMLDQTLYELQQAIYDLHHRHHLFDDYDPFGEETTRSSSMKKYSYANLKTLLSAAMTNEHTCIAGFFDLEQRRQVSLFLLTGDDDDDYYSSAERFVSDHTGLKEYLQNMLTPISQMISNCLAVIKYAETTTTTTITTSNNNNNQDEEKHQRLLQEDDALIEEKFPGWVTPSDRKLMEREASKVRAHVMVATDGSGNYSSIAEAVRMAVPEGRRNRFVIKIKAGIYNENVEIPREKTNIMLIGDGMNSTVITGSRNTADGFSTFTSATLAVVGDRFLARDLSIENTAGPWKHQAVAVRVTSNAAFYRCNFASYQDTLYTHSLRQFYRDCTIQGTVDFIFGNAAAIFQNCIILVRKPKIPGQRTVITAQGREDPNQNTGISLHNCTILAAPDLRRSGATTFLGRPWRHYSRTMVMKSYLGDLIHPEGWCRWNQYTNLKTLQYIEYKNIGPGSNTSQRVSWPGYRNNCSEGVANQFTVGAFFRDGAADHWLESTGFPLFHSP